MLFVVVSCYKVVFLKAEGDLELPNRFLADAIGDILCTGGNDLFVLILLWECDSK